MSRIIRALFQNSLHRNKNREEIKNGEIRYLPDLSIVNLLSVFLVQRILNYYPNYPTHRLYFGKSKHLICSWPRIIHLHAQVPRNVCVPQYTFPETLWYAGWVACKCNKLASPSVLLTQFSLILYRLEVHTYVNIYI